MYKTILLGILFVGIVSLMMFPIMNAMASDIQGTVTFINKAEKHGKITRTDNSSNDEYQFRIPQDLNTSCEVPLVVGGTVSFDIDPDQAKVARNVNPCGY